LKLFKRIFIAVVGGTILLLGIVMIVLPVPSLVVILAGLGILALEFAWARHWLLKVRQYMPGKKPVARVQPKEAVAPLEIQGK
jgi:hypothetical protein